MKLMGRQFVLGRDIDEAISNGSNLRKQGYRYSYDMLGEAARTGADAQRYFLAYSKAISAIAQHANNDFVHDNPGISVKLSALHPRYEYVQDERVMRELVPRMAALTEQARAANIGLNIDAEEMDRLDISLDVIEAVLRSPSLQGWDGFGVVVQAYSKQALPVLDWLNQLAIDLDRKISVRLVKGAYWDTEIKNAQVLGLRRYPVFTRKQSTDVSYLACAKRLLENSDHVYPQFATHNAHTASAILALASDSDQFEFQRLHGMGEALHDLVKQQSNRICRIYAPVGVHKDLLAYLVRRLLENGANSSFVNQVLDKDVPISQVISDPFDFIKSLDRVRDDRIPLPKDLYGQSRLNSQGWNVNDPLDEEEIEAQMLTFRTATWRGMPLIQGVDPVSSPEKVYSPVDHRDLVGEVVNSSKEDVNKAAENWGQTSAAYRGQLLEKVAELFEHHTAEFIAIANREAGKTRLDGILEIREAVDFLRYYASEARNTLIDGKYRSLGPIVCISPWNFPLAIFTGQISAALAAGNTVLAKPAEQTPLIATRAVQLFHEAGIPAEVLALLPGDGATVGAALTSDPRVKGVCFTGSTDTACLIDQSLAKYGDPRAPLIAETGGLNAMIVDSTALPEQAVRDIVQSAFQSAGQRCSALRLLVVQEDIAEHLLTMLEGATNELVTGDGWDAATDVGPVIDAEAQQMILDYMQALDQQGRCLFKTRLPKATALGTFVPAAAYKLDKISDLKKEIFGPVLHVVTFKAKQLDDTVRQINASGYGLTLGAHSRVDERMDRICALAEVGNIYLNRNQIGAVVGVQPFGGEGLSGTGPKAGGPNYIQRFVKQSVGESCRTIQNSTDLTATLLEAITILDEPDRIVVEQAILRARSINREPQLLNGPTGERNTYSLHPRGTVLCAGGGDNIVASLLTQATLAALAGNTVILSSKVAMPQIVDDLIRLLQKAGIGKDQFIKHDLDVAAICEQEQLQLVVCDAQEIGEIRSVLAARKGARVPLINSADAAHLYYQERVVSEDTTASGGNAKLLAGL